MVSIKVGIGLSCLMIGFRVLLGCGIGVKCWCGGILLRGETYRMSCWFEGGCLVEDLAICLRVS